ncbi:DUF2239 domain-containing protein [Phyllobacterium brassicacearum]|uniref:DUF2239 domain-containing protein n=1 Tax=Phyllobacterium brassicacearum TaxID=314235 RepID=A0A2P7BEL2_9HYPH|nr:DUF2239 family protein [Phyllobacterium brassicacearum]PSH64855.1 DUF2239 domain-containing protein [Phyllobacterium brassicacearum]TDQ22998.1 hypothetical protein DEV91_117101 [Phyllobacterium brassicacearum]
METTEQTCTAFQGMRKIASGTRVEVALALRRAEDIGEAILVFDDATGKQVEFDLRGSDAEIADRLDQSEPRKPGRPKLGVTAREVTLLPRQWDWLNAQPGGASVTLRKLVDAARNENGGRERKRQAQGAADSFMMVMAGNEPHYEEAARALYAGNVQRFTDLTEQWPADVCDHVRMLSEPAFGWED